MDSLAEIKGLIQTMLQQVAIMSHHVDMLQIHTSISLINLSLIKSSTKASHLINTSPIPALSPAPHSSLAHTVATPSPSPTTSKLFPTPPLSTPFLSIQTQSETQHPNPADNSPMYDQTLTINTSVYTSPLPIQSRSSSLTSPGSLISHCDKVSPSFVVSGWFLSKSCSMETKGVYAEMIVYDDGAQKLFDEMVEKKNIKPEEVSDEFYRLFESSGNKFELVSCNFLTIGLTKEVFVDDTTYVFGEMPMRNGVTWSTFVVYIFDPGGLSVIISIFDLEDKVDFEGMVMIWINDRPEPAHDIVGHQDI